MMTQLYIVTKKQDLASFVFAEDREYFAKPVPVQHIYSDRITRMPYVRDDARGYEYPVDKSCLRIGANLTNAQRAMLGGAE